MRSDSATLVVGHLSGNLILTASVLEMRPEPDKPLKPSEVATAFRDVCVQHGVSYYTADGHYWDAVLEYMGTIPCTQATLAPHEYAVRTRALMREGRLKIPRNDRLIRQLREVEARPLAGGGMSIYMPRWRTGGHGDIAQALMLMAASFGGEATPKDIPKEGTPEWEKAEKDKRRREFERQGERHYRQEGWSQRRFR